MNFSSLPLSWSVSDKIKFKSEITSMHFTRTKWLYYVNFPQFPGPDELENIISDNYFIRGINSEHKSAFSNYQKIYLGREARLRLNSNHFDKKSLRELVRRGKRFGKTIELPHSHDAIILLEKIKAICSHAKEPQLRYLFADYFSNNERLFIFRNESEIWGAVVISTNSPDTVHTELILRRDKAPIGIMEALLFDIYTILSDEIKNGYLSLGEVPFIYGDSELSMKNRLILYAGRALKPVYNYEGLYRFKNKFRPEWRDVYIAEWKKIRFLTLLGVATESRLLHLTLFKLLELFGLR